MIVTSESVAELLIRTLNLPKNCRKAELVIEVNEIALVRCEYYPDMSRDILELKKYQLVEINETGKWDIWSSPYLDAERGWK